jgi:hypothetical protein
VNYCVFFDCKVVCYLCYFIIIIIITSINIIHSISYNNNHSLKKWPTAQKMGKVIENRIESTIKENELYEASYIRTTTWGRCVGEVVNLILSIPIRIREKLCKNTQSSIRSQHVLSRRNIIYFSLDRLG